MFHPQTGSKFNFDTQQKWAVDERKNTNQAYLLFSFLLAKIVNFVFMSHTHLFNFINAICSRKYNFLISMNLVDICCNCNCGSILPINLSALKVTFVVHKMAWTAAIA